ncbi:MAG: DUF4395 domain-containing protein [Bacteroidetes bacterium]|nr:DUF4395 domain-containing protein [Bacteroidota bacterium]
MATLSDTTRRRLEVQGFIGVDEQLLVQSAPWLRLAFGLCTLLAAVGTALESPMVLLALVPIAALGAIFRVHPFDLIYNHGIRHIRGTPPLPKRGAPSRFACGLGSVWLIATAFAFNSGAMTAGHVLGWSLVLVGTLVGTIHFCIPSMIFRAIFGYPERSRTETQ